jgi:hypothetical protein
MYYWLARRGTLKLELIQTRVIQKPLLWIQVGKSACVLVGICGLRLTPPARYDPQCPSLLDFLSGCLVRVLWTCRSSTDPSRDVEQVTPYHRAFLFLIKTTVTIARTIARRGTRSPKPCINLVQYGVRCAEDQGAVGWCGQVRVSRGACV